MGNKCTCEGCSTPGMTHNGVHFGTGKGFGSDDGWWFVPLIVAIFFGALMLGSL